MCKRWSLPHLRVLTGFRLKNIGQIRADPGRKKPVEWRAGKTIVSGKLLRAGLTGLAVGASGRAGQNVDLITICGAASWSQHPAAQISRRRGWQETSGRVVCLDAARSRSRGRLATVSLAVPEHCPG